MSFHIPIVHALEAAKALGSTESAEDILQSVAEKIESKQRQQQQDKANSTVSVIAWEINILLLVTWP